MEEQTEALVINAGNLCWDDEEEWLLDMGFVQSWFSHDKQCGACLQISTHINVCFAKLSVHCSV